MCFFAIFVALKSPAKMMATYYVKYNEIIRLIFTHCNSFSARVDYFKYAQVKNKRFTYKITNN